MPPEERRSFSLSDAEIERKFRGMFRDFGSPAQCASALEGLWSVERAHDIGDVLKLFCTGKDAD